MEKLLAGYALNDGEIHSLKLEVEYSSASHSPLRQASVVLSVRKRAANDRLEPCLLKIELTGIQKVVVNDEFDSFHYSDIVFKKLDNNRWYLSLDPYGNFSEPHAEDNWVLVAESIAVEEVVKQNRF